MGYIRMNKNNERIDPEIELIDQQGGESIRYFEQDNFNTGSRLHYHLDYELRLVTAASGRIIVGDYVGTFSPNSLILIGPNMPHCWVQQSSFDQEGDAFDRSIYFSHELVTSHESSMPEMHALGPFWERASVGVEFLDAASVPEVVALFEGISNSKGFRRVVRFWMLIDILATVNNYRVLSNYSCLSHLNNKNPSRLNEALIYINENYNNDITLDKVAAHVGVSRCYFSRFFKRWTGLRMVEFINGVKVNKACEMLVRNELSITDICFEVGFNNIANFNRRFYEMKSMTPSEYRKIYRADTRYSVKSVVGRDDIV